jgi:hypothetical protein
VLRRLGGFPLELRWHGDLLAAYAAAFEQGAVYAPEAVSYFRVSTSSYSAVGRYSSAQREVLDAWFAATRRTGWEKGRRGLIAAAILPEYSVRALRALRSDPGYVTPRLIRRIGWYAAWTKLAPFIGTGVRAWLRNIRTHYRRARWSAQ